MTKNTLFFTATLALFAIGCSGDDEVKGTGDTAAAPTGDDDDDGGTIPNAFDDASLANGIDCSGDSVAISFDFLGEASIGVLDAADSANASNWNDTHTLDASGFTADGGFTNLAATLTTGAGTADWADGVSTVFTCDDHFNDVVMSYIARAYDLNGGLADCAAWGDDAAGMIAGDYFNYNETVDAGDLAGCREVTGAM